MQTNTKVKQQPKKMSFVLTPELMVLSIIIVAAVIVGATALRGTVTIEPVNKGNTEMFTNKFNNSDLDNATIESNTLNYAQNIDEQSAQSGTQGLNN
ncbi:hypothetical protein PAT01_12080 [Pseudoalteromonas atlantica]|uniref:Uncharacterized protein n=1 Tax=Pseudoalteromonas atlantica TaxID=288 RepID=A0ABQ0UFV2_PSEAF|nr:MULTISPECIES: hypothetical protein [unclassified Pseudoalteromonas]TMO08638.1 hypothetical protein CWB60_05240 [Pseudoalteromonas sp. S327]TMO19275.1 hypothetical protein CWB59_05430 [Pseudoalteromonas sp. S326]GEK75904.1 hypothetical protein PAT01_12080 [Pseudoalteromonas atlantica]